MKLGDVEIGVKIPNGNVNWSGLVEDDITTIKIELGEQIHSLLNKWNFPNDPDIKSKATALKGYY